MILCRKKQLSDENYHQPENLWNETGNRKYHTETKKEMKNKIVTL
jgi:hypothetical protein